MPVEKDSGYESTQGFANRWVGPKLDDSEEQEYYVMRYVRVNKLFRSLVWTVDRLTPITLF